MHTKETIEKIKFARAKQIITDEHKKHISEALKDRIPWNKGKKMSESFKEMRRKKTIEEWRNPEIREKRIKGMKKWIRTETTKKKIGETNKKRWENKSKKQKDDFRKKSSERQKRLFQNPEYRENLRRKATGKIGYWRNKKRPEIGGKNCHLWRGGTTKLAKQIRESIEYKIWRKEVFKQNNYTCQECKEKGKRIEAHHCPKSFQQILEENQIKTLKQALNCKELFDVKSGKTFCEDCHKKTDNYLKRFTSIKPIKVDK